MAAVTPRAFHGIHRRSPSTPHGDVASLGNRTVRRLRQFAAYASAQPAAPGGRRAARRGACISEREPRRSSLRNLSPMRLRLPVLAGTQPQPVECRRGRPVRGLAAERRPGAAPSSNQCSRAATASGAGGSRTPPGLPLKVRGEIAGCCPTPRRDQSHTPSGKAACIRAHCRA